jgi:hypothetical protein
MRGTMIPQMMFMIWYEQRARTIVLARRRVEPTSAMMT